MNWSQLGVIIRYEAKMQWRRRGLPVVLIVLLVARLVLAWFLKAGLDLEPSAAWPEAASIQRITVTLMVIMSVWSAMLLLMLALPPVVAECIPKDRQLGVYELLHSLPLSPGTYLAGKLLSVWVMLLLVLGVDAVLTGIFLRWIYGVYELVPYLALWTGIIFPLALYVSGLSVLLPAGRVTRRQAVLVGILIASYCLGMYVTPTGTQKDAISPAKVTGALALQTDYLEQASLALQQEYCEQAEIDCAPEAISALIPNFEVEPAQLIPLTVAAAALQIGIIWLVVWRWMCWKTDNGQ